MSTAKPSDYLFSRGRLSDFLAKRHEEMLKEIDGFDSDYVLNASLDDLVQYLASKYRVEPIILSNNLEIAEHGETDVDARNNALHGGSRRGERRSGKGTFVCFVLGFEGNAEIFHLSPSTASSVLPVGAITGNELRVTIVRRDHDAAAMRKQFNENLSNIYEYLDWGASDITPFNDRLAEHARQRLESRKAKFLADKEMVSALGFPIRQRPEAALAPAVRRKPLVIAKPAVRSGPFRPEPALEMEHYEHILNVISQMVLVCERSPSSFARMTEDDLRTHILVQLNGHYEGQATGETFNAHGKTDILIRVDGRNVFIAECKLWVGADSLKRAIDQLLGYTAWRDNKTAIVMFNRNKNTSAVLKQVPETVRSHPNYKRDVPAYQHPSGFRFILHQRDDKNRELILTVLVFDVPGGRYEGACPP
jgi:hypothetical protein